MQFILYFNLSLILISFLIWIALILFLRLKKSKSVIYLIFFTFFYIYIFKVLDYTLFQFQSLFLLQHFIPGLILNGEEVGGSINFIPLVTLGAEDFKTSFLNILLFIPFGFGLPFISNWRIKKVVTAGLLFSIGIELLQLLTGLLARTTFRVSDINDVVFNTAGVVIGYIVFIFFIKIWRHFFQNREVSKNQIVRYILERPQV